MQINVKPIDLHGQKQNTGTGKFGLKDTSRVSRRE